MSAAGECELIWGSVESSYDFFMLAPAISSTFNYVEYLPALELPRSGSRLLLQSSFEPTHDLASAAKAAVRPQGMLFFP